MPEEVSKAAVKYVYKSPEYPSPKPGVKQLLLKITSYLAVAVIFLGLGVAIGQEKLTIPKLPFNRQSQPKGLYVTIQATAKGKVPKNEQMTIYVSGRLIYSNKQTKKNLETTLPSDKLSQLIKIVTNINDPNLKSNYSVNCNGCLTYTITLSLGGEPLTVKTEWGARQEPASLRPLINFYENLTNELRARGQI